MIPDLSVQLNGLVLQSPLILAASPWGGEAARLGASGIGALTTNSIGPVPRTGHPQPTIHDWGEGLINAVGLDNPGAEAAVPWLREIRMGLAEQGVVLIVSIFADTAQRYYDVARTISALDPALVEVNISCPNVEAEFGAPFATQCTPAAEATRATREALTCPLSVKLAPNVPNLLQIAEGVIRAGADMLTVSNTMPGMVIDIDARRPAITNKTGGISGAALRPVAVRMVWELTMAFDVPVIGTGGVLRGRDAVEMIMAGASAVGLATVAHRHGAAGLRRVLNELDAWMVEHNIRSLDEIRGAAHT